MKPYGLLTVFRIKGFPNSCAFVPRRYRYKTKWAVNQKEMPNCQLALSNFDAFYKPYFGDQWPSIRVSLLSLPKYCAVINKYGNSEKIASQLGDLNLINFIDRVRKLQDKKKNEKTFMHLDDSEGEPELTHIESLSAPNNQQVSSSSVSTSDDSMNMSPHSSNDNEGNLEDEYLNSQNINVFVPTEQFYSERDKLLREEMSINSFQNLDDNFEIRPFEALNISQHLNAYVFPRADVSMFPQAKSHNRIIGYYLMDAASVIPVIALDVQPTDKVLDLCAAPGGKSYTILQSLDVYAGGSLTCTDSSPGRLTRLKDVLYSFFPADVAEKISVTKLDATELFQPRFNKVLVDAPCNSDRHAVTEDDNNLFKLSRTRDRLGLIETQKKLLISGIRCCVPGGTIVYSTCTLSPAQNDHVIQAVIEALSGNSEIEVAVYDLSPLTKLFSKVFKFYKQSKYGQLILPDLMNNFGPTYVAKLKRIK
ncbi:unnamed protein product [Candidula unifasciata]|uniref:NOL1/NOP2/Sun domain family member 4 n=1 Tax=Candidula unifasciata TaxID=100452 RepID=A0A8S3YPS3_9EUPU|nr:unnamed protein product [Candidula unifasciata]